MNKSRRARIESLVEYLCSRECAGRKPNSKEGIAARERIVEELRAAGATPGGTDGYLQAVPRCGANVLAEVAGSGPLADRAIIVAAHYDHLGKTSGGRRTGAPTTTRRRWRSWSRSGASWPRGQARAGG
jgi:hypothetical protein